MQTLEEVLELPDNTNVNVKVKVLQCREVLKQSTNNKSYFEAVVGDETGTVHMKVFQEQQHQKFLALPSIFLQDVIKKPNALLFTVKSKAPYCATVVPSNKQLAQSSQSRVGSIKEVLSSNTKMDIVCRVIKSSPVKAKTSTYSGLGLSLKHIMVKDSTATTKVALWEDNATMDIKENSVVKISAVKSTTFNKIALLGTTKDSSIELLPDDSAIPLSSEEDMSVFETDPDFATALQFSGIIQGFDNINIYAVCTNPRCHNKILKNNTCVSCGTSPSTTKLYLRSTLTVQHGQSYQTLTLFYPEYCTLCAAADLACELKEQTVTNNLTSLIGRNIKYTLRQSTIATVVLKRQNEAEVGDFSIHVTCSMTCYIW